MAQAQAAVRRWGGSNKRKASTDAPPHTPGPSQQSHPSPISLATPPAVLAAADAGQPETLQQQQLLALAGSVQKLHDALAMQAELMQTQQKEVTRLTTSAAAAVAAAAVATAPVAAAAVAAAAAAEEEAAGVSDSEDENDAWRRSPQA